MNKTVDILVGLQYGDEGKGKVVKDLCDNYDVVARFNGGPNAGHTIYYNDTKVVLHHVPCGIFNTKAICIIGAGVIVDLFTLKEELDLLDSLGLNATSRLKISTNAHLILPTHKLLDRYNEQINKIGTTLKGIGPCFTDKVSRKGIKIGDILKEGFAKKFTELNGSHLSSINNFEFNRKQMFEDTKNFLHLINEFVTKLHIINTEDYIQSLLSNNLTILAEGAQGTQLDIDYGDYPYVTSSNTLASYACVSLGIPIFAVNKIYGVAKPYITKVGNGSFKTEYLMSDELKLLIATRGKEIGATTGRPRRIGALDIDSLKKAIYLNGVTDLIITKLDILEDLVIDGDCFPLVIDNDLVMHKSWTETRTKDRDLSNFITYLEKELNVPISYISISPIDKMIKLN